MTGAQAREALTIPLLMAGFTDKGADKALSILLDEDRKGLLAAAAGLFTGEQVADIVTVALREGKSWRG